MNDATHKDILRLFPDLQDHAVVEILSLKASPDDLEAAFALLNHDDTGLSELKTRDGGKIHQLIDILVQADLPAVADRDR